MSVFRVHVLRHLRDNVTNVTEHPTTPAPTEPDDLALNRPGATLRLKAKEIRKTHPLLVFILRLFGAHSQERAWRRGAEGEEEVAWQLRKLGEGWHALHSVPIGSGETDIDHLVIGPPGVFALNTKNHLGKRVTVYEKAIYVSGSKQPYLTKSRAEGRRASKLLSRACNFPVTVSPMLVIMANELDLKGQPTDVHVVARKRLANWIEIQTPCLSAAETELIYAAARRRSTWISYKASLGDTCQNLDMPSSALELARDQIDADMD